MNRLLLIIIHIIIVLVVSFFLYFQTVNKNTLSSKMLNKKVQALTSTHPFFGGRERVAVVAAEKPWQPFHQSPRPAHPGKPWSLPRLSWSWVCFVLFILARLLVLIPSSFVLPRFLCSSALVLCSFCSVCSHPCPWVPSVLCQYRVSEFCDFLCCFCSKSPRTSGLLVLVPCFLIFPV